MSDQFTKNLLSWYQIHGRHDLPWQQNPTPYRVWVSEVMLQQTQVNTVIEYYQRFINKFSSVRLLSEASQDAVLGLWSGLGYYARARNLHRCAQIVCERYQGNFPRTIAELTQLPGIGLSTAGAILSFSMQTRAPILDGNVRRVLTRYHAVEGIVTDKQVVQQLWETASSHTPSENFAQYNQAIMDLGATVCTRHRPACTRCPVSAQCQALAQSRPHEFPKTAKAQKVRPKKSAYVFIIQNSQGQVWLEKRPPAGIWGGLWGFPQCEMDENIISWCLKYLNAKILHRQDWPAFSHAFTHFELMIHPVLLTVKNSSRIGENNGAFWHNLSDPLPGGMATPMVKLLQQLKG